MHSTQKVIDDLKLGKLSQNTSKVYKTCMKGQEFEQRSIDIELNTQTNEAK